MTLNNNQPLSEQYRIVAKKWVDAKAAADMLEESKTAVLSQRMMATGEQTISKAEMTVKASAEWQEYLTQMVEARAKANLLKVQLEYIQMQFSEWQSSEATRRAEIQLLPALLALNVGVLVSLTVLTFVFGRVYCSSICPLGVYQDLVSWLGKRTVFLPVKKSGGGKKAGGERKKRKSGRKRYRYLEPANWLRYGFLALTILGFVAGETVS